MVNRGRTRLLAEKVRRLDAQGLRVMFAALVRAPEQWKARRRRLYDPARTFWMFLEQTLCEDKSCTQAVARNAARRMVEGKEPASPDTGAYCKARKRLALDGLAKINDALVEQALRTREPQGPWKGRRVHVVDGSTVSMPDTPENQALYPQPSGQAPGCGFPMMRLVAVFSLATGAMTAFARESLKGSERPLFRSLWNMLNPGDVVLADRGFCGYAEGYLLARQGVDWVMRNHANRTVGLSVRRRIGKNDRIVEWRKTKVRPPWMAPDQWRGMPDRLTVREITVHVDIPGFRTKVIVMVTSLTDEKKFSAEDFAQLYRRRWLCEWFLRDIKTTLGMDILRCKTPEMAHKELLMHIIAYNLLRALMAQAAAAKGLAYCRLSFKTALSTVRQWETLFAHCADSEEQAQCLQHMLHYMARAGIPDRPNRIEPRAIKRRPKEYDRLNRPRNVMRRRLMDENP